MHRPSALLLACAAALLVAAAACTSPADQGMSAAEEIRTAPAPAAEAAPPLRVFATGDSHGYLEPCGCERGQVGGIPRRATYAQRVRRPGDLWIDLGNLTGGTESVRAVRQAAILEGLAGIGYDLVVPGRMELLEGAAFDAAAKARNLRLVCANLVGADGRTVHEPFAVFDLPDGRRAGVVGLAEPVEGLPDGRRTLPPAATLRSALVDLHGRADVVIAATSLPEPAARELAAATPGVALVLSGSTPDPDVPRVETERALLATAGHLGQYVTRVDFDAGLRPAVTWRSWLEEDVPDAPWAAELVKRYRAAVSGIDVKLVDDLLAARRKEGFAGSATCRSCHREDYDIWKASLHGRAMEILVEKKVNRDPDCVPCHLVDLPDEAEPFDPDAMGVGCEACHGGSAAHVADPSVKTPAGSEGSRALCAPKCHHPPEVKNFDFDVQWPRIRHGGK